MAKIILIDLYAIVDIDEALCRFLFSHQKGKEITQQIRERKTIEYPPELHEFIELAMRARGFFLALEPFPYAIRSILKLCERHTVIIVGNRDGQTPGQGFWSRFSNHLYAEQDKRTWIERKFTSMGHYFVPDQSRWGPILAKRALFVDDKTCLRGDLLIDVRDHPYPSKQALFKPEWDLIIAHRRYNESIKGRKLMSWYKDVTLK
jgi:hypothetical protein